MWNFSLQSYSESDMSSGLAGLYSQPVCSVELYHQRAVSWCSSSQELKMIFLKSSILAVSISKSHWDILTTLSVLQITKHLSFYATMFLLPNNGLKRWSKYWAKMTPKEPFDSGFVFMCCNELSLPVYHIKMGRT